MSELNSTLVRVSDVYLLGAECQGFTNYTPISDNSLIIRSAGTERKSDSGDKIVNDYHFLIEDGGQVKISSGITFIKDVVKPIDEDFVSIMGLRNPKDGSVAPGLLDVESIAKYNNVRFDFEDYNELDFRNYSPTKIYAEACAVNDGVPAMETLEAVMCRINEKESLFNAPGRHEKEAHFDKIADLCQIMGVSINAPGVVTVLMAHAFICHQSDKTTGNLRRAIGYSALLGEITDRSEK